MYIFISGYIESGIRFFGPFLTKEDAIRNSPNWWRASDYQIIELENPKVLEEEYDNT